MFICIFCIHVLILNIIVVFREYLMIIIILSLDPHYEDTTTTTKIEEETAIVSLPDRMLLSLTNDPKHL